MYRILLIDDEQIALDSMEHIILHDFDDKAEIGKAHSGREAIERAEQMHPHIAITDIKMPGINGIDTIREIKQNCPDARFIVLSAYDEFEYAKEALELGVEEYLLKPANRAKLVDALRRAAEHIGKERSRRTRELHLKEKVERTLPSLESGFIFTALFFDDNEAGLSNYKELFDIESEIFYVMTIELSPLESGPESQIGVDEAARSLYSDCRDAIKRLAKCYVGPIMGNRIAVLVSADLHEREFARRVNAVALANDLLEKLPAVKGVGVSVGIGRIYDSLGKLRRSYGESLLALGNRQGFHKSDSKMVFHIDDVQVLPPEMKDYPIEGEKRLRSCLEMGDEEGALRALDMVFDYSAERFGGDLNRLKCSALELLTMAYRVDIEFESQQATRDYDRHIALIGAQSVIEARQICRMAISSVAQSVALRQKTRTSQVIRRAMEFIDKNYSGSITLDDISKELNISPHYFSRLYKAETGQNFIDHLTRLRMDRAKALVLESELSMKEIAYSVGYSDPNYFSRLFKKATGETPTEYKERASRESH